MSNDIRNYVATVEPFSRLSGLELDGFALQLRQVTHEKGETIYSEGDEAHSVWLLRTGRIEIFKYSADGRPTAIESILPKGLYGMYCRIGGDQKAYPCTAIAATESTSVCIPDSLFWNTFRRNAGFVTGICTLCSQRLSGMQDIAGAAHEPVHRRIVKTLVNLSKTNGATLPYTKREIAELSSTTVETAIRTLSAFERKHWISSERGQITLKDRRRLEALMTS